MSQPNVTLTLTLKIIPKDHKGRLFACCMLELVFIWGHTDPNQVEEK